MVGWRKAFNLISSWDHCQRSSPSWISDIPRAGFEPAQNLTSGLVEWRCAVVITTASNELDRFLIGLCISQKTLIQEFVKIVWINHINGPYQRKRICDFKINAKFQPLSNKPIYGAISRTLRWHHSCISLATIRDQYIDCQVFQKYQGFP